MKWVNLLLITFCVGFHSVSIAHDRDGKYAQANPEMHKWIEGLKSGKGACCSDADGTALSDIDWEAPGQGGNKTEHYRVKIEDQWWEVPDDAVITEPNKLGKAMVWPIYNRTNYGDTPTTAITIRCFMPGSLS